MGFKRKYLVEFRFKSGNKYRVWLQRIECKYSGEDLTDLSWSILREGPNPMLFISLPDIEHIAVLKKWWYWSWG